jgi:hypothetical protein
MLKRTHNAKKTKQEPFKGQTLFTMESLILAQDER